MVNKQGLLPLLRNSRENAQTMWAVSILHLHNLDLYSSSKKDVLLIMKATFAFEKKAHEPSSHKNAFEMLARALLDRNHVCNWEQVK